MNTSCDRPVYAKGLCRKHYDQARHAGTLEVAHWSKSNRDQAFWDRVDRGAPEACWPWTKAMRKGYGRLRHDGRTLDAHRVAFSLAHGHLPPEVDHTCNNHSCCNPAHLREATHKENMENLLVVRSSTGHRGVYPYKGKYRAKVTHHGQPHYLGQFDTVEAAAEAARLKRNELFTHNDRDRMGEIGDAPRRIEVVPATPAVKPSPQPNPTPAPAPAPAKEPAREPVPA